MPGWLLLDEAELDFLLLVFAFFALVFFVVAGIVGGLFGVVCGVFSFDND